MSLKYRVKRFGRHLIYSENWNIGFSDTTVEAMLKKGCLSKVHWMKHKYNDRWFADPFLYKVDSKTLIVFAEELEIDYPKGRLVELHIDRSTYELRERFVILDIDSHLSFPVYFVKKGVTYVYPENGESGKLNLYKYDCNQHSLIWEKVLIHEALADAIIFERGEHCFMFATRSESSQKDCYLFSAEKIDGHYLLYSNNVFVEDSEFSRSVGNVLTSVGRYYRVVQNCSLRYGGSVNIMELVFENETPVRQSFVMEIKPSGWKYNLGLHTLNFKEEMCIIDGKGYLYPLFGRLYYSAFVTKMKTLLKNILS